MNEIDERHPVIARAGPRPCAVRGEHRLAVRATLGDHTAPPVLRRRRLVDRIAIIAAIEHFTAVLGRWVLEARGYDRVPTPPCSTCCAGTAPRRWSTGP